MYRAATGAGDSYLHGVLKVCYWEFGGVADALRVGCGRGHKPCQLDDEVASTYSSKRRSHQVIEIRHGMRRNV